MTQDILTVWLRSERIGELERLRNGRLRLRYSAAAVAAFGVGAAPLSLSLPVQERRLEGDAVEAFIDGLLPEGPLREQLNREFGARTPYDLLRHLGAECAGAVQFTPGDTAPSDGHLRPLTSEEVARMVAALPTLDPPEGEPIGASLGGIQAKLLLTRTAEGWAWPADGAMSTHIIKPQAQDTGSPPHLIQAENWAMAVAARAGLRVASTELHEFDGRPTLIVTRFDREHGARTHQEDFTQALGLRARSKYEATLTGERRLLRIAEQGSANASSPRRFLDELFTQVAFNTLIGNADAHSKNYSLAIDPSALYFPTPLYDVAPVLFLGAYTHSGHAIRGQVDLRRITRDHLLDEAASWGLRPRTAARMLDDLIEATADAVTSSDPPDELPRLPEQVLRRVRGFAVS